MPCISDRMSFEPILQGISVLSLLKVSQEKSMLFSAKVNMNVY